MAENRQSELTEPVGPAADEQDDPMSYLQLMYEQAAEMDAVDRIRSARTSESDPQH